MQIYFLRFNSRFGFLIVYFRLADLAESFGDSVTNSPSSLAYSLGAATIGMGLWWMWQKPSEGQIKPLVDLNSQTRVLSV
jgi:hypothetical protein